MAIIKRAKNMTEITTRNHITIAKTIEDEAKQIFVYSTKEDLSLNSNKKIIIHGNSK